MRFENNVVVITGGGSGMGLAAARMFAAEGAIVAINDLLPDRVDDAVAQVEAAGGRAFAIAGDVSEEEVARERIREVVSRQGRVDVLVNCAGISTIKPAVEYDAWRRTMGVNLDAPFYWSRAAAIAA